MTLPTSTRMLSTNALSRSTNSLIALTSLYMRSCRPAGVAPPQGAGATNHRDFFGTGSGPARALACPSDAWQQCTAAGYFRAVREHWFRGLRASRRPALGSGSSRGVRLSTEGGDDAKTHSTEARSHV